MQAFLYFKERVKKMLKKLLYSLGAAVLGCGVVCTVVAVIKKRKGQMK